MLSVWERVRRCLEGTEFLLHKWSVCDDWHLWWKGEVRPLDLIVGVYAESRAVELFFFPRYLEWAQTRRHPMIWLLTFLLYPVIPRIDSESTERARWASPAFFVVGLVFLFSALFASQ